MGVLMHQTLLGFIYDKYRTQMNVVLAIILVQGLNQRVYGYQNLPIVSMMINCLIMAIALPLYLYCDQALVNIMNKLDIEVTKMMQEVSLVKRVQKEQKEIFESLEEGILLIKENEIAFSNSIFNDIIQKF
jgi:hypothetical protein